MAIYAIADLDPATRDHDVTAFSQFLAQLDPPSVAYMVISALEYEMLFHDSYVRPSMSGTRIHGTMRQQVIEVFTEAEKPALRGKRQE